MKVNCLLENTRIFSIFFRNFFFNLNSFYKIILNKNKNRQQEKTNLLFLDNFHFYIEKRENKHVLLDVLLLFINF